MSYFMIGGTNVMVGQMSYFIIGGTNVGVGQMSYVVKGGTNVRVGQMSGGTNVSGTNVGGTCVSGTVWPDWKSFLEMFNTTQWLRFTSLYSSIMMNMCWCLDDLIYIHSKFYSCFYWDIWTVHKVKVIKLFIYVIFFLNLIENKFLKIISAINFWF
jgi:hypothetical protein